MSKGNRYTQPTNRTQSSTETLAPVAPKATLSGTEERLNDLEELVAALVVRSGSGLSRCRCGAFATRNITMDHPIAGIHANTCCDECDHPQSIAQDKRATTTAFELPKVRTARRLNSVIQRAFARAEETVAEAAE
jgi:hypothetical protein